MWHVAGEYVPGLEKWKELAEGVRDAFGAEEENRQERLRYRVPTKAREQSFARAAVKAAASVATEAAASAGSPKEAQGGVRWPQGLVGTPGLKPTENTGDSRRVLLALALSSALIGGAALLQRSGLRPTVQRAIALESRLASALGRQSKSRGTGRGGVGFRVNWAGELRSLLGGSTR